MEALIEMSGLSYYMAYSTTVKLTAELILEKLSEYQIFQYYLGINPDLSKSFLSPFRVDNTPGCKFYISGNTNRLKFKDYAGRIDEDCFGIVSILNNCNYPQSLEKIASDFKLYNYSNTLPGPFISKSPTLIQEKKTFFIKRRNWNKIDADFWKPYLIDSKTLKDYNTYAVHAVWLKEGAPYYIYSEDDPCYCYGFRDGCKLYFPYRKKGSRKEGYPRFLTNSREAQGISFLQEGGDYCIITKSYKDVICMSRFGIPAIAPHGETTRLTNEEYNYIAARFNKIYSLYDYDDAGRIGSERLEREYNIEPLFIKDEIAKDFSDYVKEYGYHSTIDMFNELIL